MTAITHKQKLANERRAIRRARELKNVSRQDLAVRMEVSSGVIEKLENGWLKLTPERRSQILDALEISEHDFHLIKKGKKLGLAGRKRRIVKNQERRSYQRNITKECRVLKILRTQKKISQDIASNLCGYSRPTIGHIENGRIELTPGRVRHIVTSYEYSMREFNDQLNVSQLRDEVMEECISILESVSTEKLQSIHMMLGGITKF